MIEKTSFVAILFCLVSFALVVTGQLSSSKAWQLSNQTVGSVNRLIDKWFEETNKEYLNLEEWFNNSSRKITEKLLMDKEKLMAALNHDYDEAVLKLKDQKIDTRSSESNRLNDKKGEMSRNIAECTSQRIKGYGEDFKEIKLKYNITDDLPKNTFTSESSNCITESDPFKIIDCVLSVQEAAVMATTKYKLYIAAAKRKILVREDHNMVTKCFFEKLSKR